MATSSRKNKLEAQNITKIFSRGKSDEVVALKDITFQVEEGEFLTILGPSGCGKSTLLRCIAGFEKITNGHIYVRRKQVQDPGPDRAIVFQSFDQLLPWKTVLKNITMPLTVNGIKKGRAKEIGMAQLELMGLTQSSDLFPHQLSGGMKQRVAIARALALNPDILLMDEPFASLDAQNRERLQKELSSIWRKTKKTVLFVTHSIDEALILGTKILILSSHPGRLKKIIANNLPVPRDPNSVEYIEQRSIVYESIESRA